MQDFLFFFKKSQFVLYYFIFRSACETGLLPFFLPVTFDAQAILIESKMVRQCPLNQNYYIVGPIAADY